MPGITNPSNSTLNGIESSSADQPIVHGGNMQYETLFANAIRREAPETVTPAIQMTREEIEAIDPLNVLNTELTSGRIALTIHSDVAREQKIPVIYSNRLQHDQLARMLAYSVTGIYEASQAGLNNGLYAMTLKDSKGNNDRVIFSKLNESGHVDFYPYYGRKSHNMLGQFIGIEATTTHPVLRNLTIRCEEYNAWVDRRNEAVNAVARAQATEEQLKLIGESRPGADPNRWLMQETLKHINPLTLVDKYTLLGWYLLQKTHPAFAIFTRSKNAEHVEKHLKWMGESMRRPFHSELRKLAGIKVENA